LYGKGQELEYLPVSRYSKINCVDDNTWWAFPKAAGWLFSARTQVIAIVRVLKGGCRWGDCPQLDRNKDATGGPKQQ
jgi:hypothetical protein